MLARTMRPIDKIVWGWNEWEEQQIRDARGYAGGAAFESQMALESVAELRGVVLQQRAQIEQMGVLVGVLVKILAERGGIDEKVLHYRVEAEIDALTEAKAARAAAASKPAGPLVKCVRCDRMVPTTATLLTPEGTTCDSCLASGI